MAKLYFKFGPMGCSKTANALMTKFNYEEKGKRVLLLKPSIDTRDGVEIVRSRIGLEAKAECIKPNQDIRKYVFEKHWSSKGFDFDVVIVDEVQFFQKTQIEDLRYIASFNDIPVICYGLRTNYKLQLFEGSKALFELADSIQELKTVCKCGNKAIINVLKDEDGNIVTDTGDSDIILGGNEKYEAMCFKCYHEAFAENEKKNKKYLVEVTLFTESEGSILTGKATGHNSFESAKEDIKTVLQVLCENNKLPAKAYMADVNIQSYYANTNKNSPFVKIHYEKGDKIVFYWDGKKVEFAPF